MLNKMDSFIKGFIPIPTSTLNNKNDLYVRGLTNEIIKFQNPELSNRINEISIRPPHGELSLTGEKIKKVNKENLYKKINKNKSDKWKNFEVTGKLSNK